MHRITDDALWSFETAQFFVGFYAEPEELDPADSFEFEEDIAAVRNSEVEWFSAAVRVYFKGDSEKPSQWHEVGSDYLGGCAYKSVSDFYTAHRGQRVGAYFSDMVSEAIGLARANVSKFKHVHMRA